MKLIIGGAFQGKLEYAKREFPKLERVESFHEIIKSQLEDDMDVLGNLRQNLEKYKDKVIICDDISCGVVPMDPKLRKWREIVGQALVLIAAESDEVIRVFCGIGTKLK